MTCILCCICSQTAKFWTIWWTLEERKRSVPGCPECVTEQLPVAPCPKPCIFPQLYFLYVVGVISFTCQPGYCSWAIHTSTAVWLPREFGGRQEEAGGSGFALATALIRGGIRKCHPGAAASCCFLPRGRKMWFFYDNFLKVMCYLYLNSSYLLLWQKNNFQLQTGVCLLQRICSYAVNQFLILSGFIMNISEFGPAKSACLVYWGAELIPCGSLKKMMKEGSLVKFSGRTDMMQAKLLSVPLWDLLTQMPTVTQGSRPLLESNYCCDVMQLTWITCTSWKVGREVEMWNLSSLCCSCTGLQYMRRESN